MTTPPRKIRCWRRDQLDNRCTNEALDGFGLCLACLREIGDHWEFVKAAAVRQFPGLQRILPAGHPSNVHVSDLCRRCGRPHPLAACDTVTITRRNS